MPLGKLGSSPIPRLVVGFFHVVRLLVQNAAAGAPVTATVPATSVPASAVRTIQVNGRMGQRTSYHAS